MTSMPAPASQTPRLSLEHFVEGDSRPDRAKAIRESIAFLAYQFFEERGHQHGHDLEDWLRAESEILVPIAVKSYEFDDTLIIRMEVPVLTSDDIEVSVEPRRITISDRDRTDLDPSLDTKPNKRLFHTIVLPERVDWASTASAFKDGVLEVEVPKLSPGEALTA